MNTRFAYLYRDAGNWKRFGEVVLGGRPDHLTAERLAKACQDGMWFVADQVRLPELFFTDMPGEDDHCWHELEDVSAITDPSTDPHGRSIHSFVEEFERAAERGWRVWERTDELEILRREEKK